MEGRERVGERRKGGPGRLEPEVTRERVRGGGGQGKGEQHQPVVRGHRARRPREQRAGDVGDRLRVGAEGDRAAELLHHGERVVVPTDDLHAEEPLGWRAQNGGGDDQRDDERDRRDRGHFPPSRAPARSRRPARRLQGFNHGRRLPTRSRRVWPCGAASQRSRRSRSRAADRPPPRRGRRVHGV